jgi:deleted-in-malignant-brain-tumors protein 1
LKISFFYFDILLAQDPNVAVRLVGGSTSNQGRAEVRYYGVWGRVCTNNWQLIDAHVVCRMLNYSKASWAGRSSINGKGSVLLSNLGCYGKETSVEQCHDSEWGLAYCNSQQNAGVVCGNLSTGK